MSNLVGRVKFTASIDGKGMPNDARRVGHEAGTAMGDGYDEKWQKSFRDSLTAAGKRAYKQFSATGKTSGTAFGQGFKERIDAYITQAEKSFNGIRLDNDFLDRFAKQFDDAGLAAGRLQEQMKTLHEVNKITDKQYESIRTKIDAWAIAQRDLADYQERFAKAQEDGARKTEELDARLQALNERFNQHNQARKNLIRVTEEHNRSVERGRSIMDGIDFPKLWSGLDGTSDRVDGLSLRWKDLGHNTRQWTLIIGAVLAAMDELSALGSALGGGIMALGGALVSTAYGLGTLVSGILLFNKELDEIPPNLRGVAEEFQGLKEGLGDLQVAIGTGMARELNGTFTAMRQNLASLHPQFETLGQTVGSVLDRIAKGTRPGSEGFGQLALAADQANRNVQLMSNAAGTMFLALLRGANRAQPAVYQLIGYIDKLGNRLDAFTKSRSFDDWIARSMHTWTVFGGLLDAVSRTLNDLVTPESVVRTQNFMRNLTEFMPNLTNFLTGLGKLNVFGLLASALNQIGQAMAPLTPVFWELMEVVNELASDLIGGLAGSLSVIVTVAKPVLTVLTDLLGVLVDSGLAGGVLILAGAFTAFKTAAAIDGVVRSATAALASYSTTAATASATTTRLTAGLKAGLGKAGVIGGAIVGAIALGVALNDLHRSIRDIEGVSRNAIANNAALSKSFETLGTSAFGLQPSFDAVKGSLDQLDSVGPQLERFFPTLIATFSESGRAASAMASSLADLDKPLSALAAQNLPAATDQFRAWAEEMGASDAQVLKMLSNMPEFQAVLEQAALAEGRVASEADLVAMALGRTSSEQRLAASAASYYEGQLAALEGRSVDTGNKIDELSDKIRNFGSAELDSRAATREFEQAIADLTESVAQNGATLDIQTQQGRDNEAALDAIARAALEATAATYDQTNSQEQANAVLQTGRDRLIAMLEQFGITGAAADQYADKLGLIPGNIDTAVDLLDQDARNRIDRFIRDYSGRKIPIYVQEMSTGKNRTNIGMFASGGTLYGPRQIIAGEAGPEAIVPLSRPLSMVDPSVRWLSAIAQGKTKMASGGIVGTAGTQVSVSDGASLITVVGSEDSRGTALEVMDALIEGGF